MTSLQPIMGPMKESKAVTEEWERGKTAPADALVPDAFREQTHRDILNAFGLKTWQVGLTPAPLHARVRGRVNRASAHRRAGLSAYGRPRCTWRGMVSELIRIEDRLSA